MSSLELAGASGALDNINATQAEFRAQIAALNDLMRQVAGTANVAAGSSEMVDPLTAPFTLYVNPYIGEDTFAAGSYNTYEAPGGSTDEEIIEAKLKRLDKQRLRVIRLQSIHQHLSIDLASRFFGAVLIHLIF